MCWSEKPEIPDRYRIIPHMKKKIIKWIMSLFFVKEWEMPHKKCSATGVCQETEGFKGTEHEGIDVCEDGCVWGKQVWKFKWRFVK
jgi:hypothetical protein